MNEPLSAERKRGDVMKIATGLNVSKRYVNNILAGDRKVKSPRAKAIIKLNGELQKLNERFEVKAKKIKQELLDQE